MPVNILRDTGSDVTLISSSVLPFSDESDTGDSVSVMGMGLQTIPAPLHTVMIESDLTEGKVVMGVVSGIPGRDGAVDILLGNDLAGLSVYSLFRRRSFQRLHSLQWRGIWFPRVTPTCSLHAL